MTQLGVRREAFKNCKYGLGDSPSAWLQVSSMSRRTDEETPLALIQLHRYKQTLIKKKTNKHLELLHCTYLGLLPDLLHLNTPMLKMKDQHLKPLGKSGDVRRAHPIKENTEGVTHEFQESADGVMCKQSPNGNALPAMRGLRKDAATPLTLIFRVNAGGELLPAGQDPSEPGFFPGKLGYPPRQAALQI